MKKWIMGAAILVFTSLGAAAQQEKRELPNPEERAKKMTDRMASELELSEDQKAKVLAINLENAQKRQAQMEKELAERKARMEELKVQEEKIKEVLTEEQRKKWEEIKLEQQEQRRSGGEGHDRRHMPHHGKERN